VPPSALMMVWLVSVVTTAGMGVSAFKSETSVYGYGHCGGNAELRGTPQYGTDQWSRCNRASSKWNGAAQP
jgi:hypothetical protein